MKAKRNKVKGLCWGCKKIKMLVATTKVSGFTLKKEESKIKIVNSKFNFNVQGICDICAKYLLRRYRGYRK